MKLENRPNFVKDSIPVPEGITPFQPRDGPGDKTQCQSASPTYFQTNRKLKSLYGN